MDKIACSHCNVEFHKSSLIEQTDDDRTLYFCCTGCQGVYNLLLGEGLNDFYRKTNNKNLAPPKKILIDTSYFDSDGYIKKYVKQVGKLSEVSLILDGIHCSACIWLNEKVLQSKDAIIEANINFTTHKAKIVYDQDNIKLSQIIEIIRSIGYDAFAYDSKLKEERSNTERKNYYYKMAVAIFATMNIMWIAVAQYSGYFTGMNDELRLWLNIAEWILSTPVLFYSGWIFLRGAYYGMKNHIVNMDTLVSTGALLTYLYSIYITLFTKSEAYFDSVAMIVTFILIGKFLEVLSKKRAVDRLDVMSHYMPFEALVVTKEEIKKVPIDSLRAGDIIELKAGERACVDGEVTHGDGGFDESNITGESKEIFKTKGSNIISGSLLTEGWIRYIATKDYAHSTMSKILNMLDTAQENRPKIEILAKRISEHFSLVVLFLSFATALFWIFNNNSFESSFIVGISVVIIACPCALALATPLASLVGLGIAIKEAIIFKESKYFEVVANVDSVVFDKTGTITKGEPNVISFDKIKDFDESLLFSLVSLSKHPISLGIKKYLSDKELEIKNLKNIKTITAKGIYAKYDGLDILGGNKKLMLDSKIDVLDDESENTLFYFAISDIIVAKIELEDTIKDDAKELISYLKSKNIKQMLLSGDTKEVCEKVCDAVGISNFIHSVNPEEKLEYIKKLQSENKNVMMVGDGINDALALAQSNVAVAMGNGSDIAVDVSDVILLDDSLKKLKRSFEISKATFSLIKQNLALSLLYNAITIPLAMLGYIIPLIAAISMSASSLIVILNSLRMRAQ